jgi:hypothetical protein
MTTVPNKPANPNETKPTLGLGKPTMEAKASPEVKVSLKAICMELKLDLRSSTPAGAAKVRRALSRRCG